MSGVKWLRLGGLLAVLAGVAWYAGWLPRLTQLATGTLALPEVMPPAPQLFRWKDARGQITYGTQPPPGVKAEPVADKGTMSMVPAAKIPEPPKKELPPGVTIQQLATERAIDQATGAK